MLIATSIVEKIVDNSLPLFLVEIILAGFGVFGIINFFRHNNVKAQLAAKDAVINTNQQTIESIEDRLKAVEDELVGFKEKNESLTKELKEWENKYNNLENYAAPVLGEKLVEMFKSQEDVLNKIVNVLEGIESRIDTLENKSK